MEELSSLSLQQQRKVAAVVGACVADAAAQPMHWIYKADVLNKLLEETEEIEFREPSANPFYRIATGRNSCYGDEAYVVLKSLVDSKGLNIEHLTQATYDFFGPESEFENKETNEYMVGKENKIDLKPSLPIHAPWRHGCIKDFLKNLANKKNPPGSLTDDQIDCAIRIIPLVALYAGHPDMLIKVEEALRILQDNDMPVCAGLAMARILEQYILNETQEDVLETVLAALTDQKNSNSHELDAAIIGQIRMVVKVKDTPHILAISQFFKNSCHLPESMQSTLHGLITAKSYVDGIRSTMKVGGCSASRSGFIGACMAAKEGFDQIPTSWRNKTLRYKEVLDLALKLVEIEKLNISSDS